MGKYFQAAKEISKESFLDHLKSDPVLSEYEVNDYDNYCLFF